MSSNVAIVSEGATYTYPIPKIGTETLGDPSLSIAIDTGIKEAYEKLFGEHGEYTKRQTILNDQFWNVLALLGTKSGNTITIGDKQFETDASIELEDLFDAIFNATDGALVDKEIAKEGLKAYKFYLREAISLLNNFRDCISKANTFLSTLTTSLSSDEAHAIVVNLSIEDEYAQSLLKKLTEYVTIIQVDATKKVYSEGYTTPKEQKSTYQEGTTAYKNLSEGFSSWVSEDLQNVKTPTYSSTKIFEYVYVKGDVDTSGCESAADISSDYYADIYDSSAKLAFFEKETKSSHSTHIMELFDELTLLEKLEYIVRYYNAAEKHYVYPSDDPKTFGYPCVEPDKIYKTKTPEATFRGPEGDVEEIGQLELFYIGYLIDRDGCVNALASLMEVKAAAIRQQITLLSYRVKALKFCLNLINRGLEKLNESQSQTAKESGDYRGIPYHTYLIMRYVCANVTRTLYFPKKTDGTPVLIDDKGEAVPFLVFQYQDANGTNLETCDFGDDTGYHASKNGIYILVPATDDGVETFATLNSLIDWADESGVVKGKERAGADCMFKSLVINQTISGGINNGPYNIHIPEENTNGYTIAQDGVWFLQLSDGDSERELLPKELGTARVNAASLLEDQQDGMAWHNPKMSDDSDKAKIKVAWPSFIERWQKTFDQAIDNTNSKLKEVNQTINSLRRKINTMDTSASTFRSKIYNIYTKIVNNIE